MKNEQAPLRPWGFYRGSPVQRPVPDVGLKGLDCGVMDGRHRDE